MQEEFQSLKQLFGKIKELHTNAIQFNILSMGMSGDYEVAIEEGATLIRLGTILVGDLPNP